jgi:nucleoside-diphosphate-sugar epimerase
MALILVTGGTGYLGTNIPLQLLELGHQVRAFGLPGSTTKYIAKPGVENGPLFNFNPSEVNHV